MNMRCIYEAFESSGSLLVLMDAVSPLQGYLGEPTFQEIKKVYVNSKAVELSTMMPLAKNVNIGHSGQGAQVKRGKTNEKWANGLASANAANEDLKQGNIEQAIAKLNFAINDLDDIVVGRTSKTLPLINLISTVDPIAQNVHKRIHAVLQVLIMARDALVAKQKTSSPPPALPSTSQAIPAPVPAPVPATVPMSNSQAPSPITSNPISSNPISSNPISSSPITPSPITSNPISSNPISSNPITSSPITSSPITSNPITSISPALPVAQETVDSSPPGMKPDVLVDPPVVTSLDNPRKKKTPIEQPVSDGNLVLKPEPVSPPPTNATTVVDMVTSFVKRTRTKVKTKQAPSTSPSSSLTKTTKSKKKKKGSAPAAKKAKLPMDWKLQSLLLILLILVFAICSCMCLVLLVILMRKR